VQRVVEPEALLDVAHGWCARAAELPPHAFAMTKPLRAAADAPFEHALVVEEYAEANCFSTAALGTAAEAIRR
jgi:2-(1,2-epoxy-1,2-dihydrophenyl)acetyl-CoA isomerase